MKLITRIALRLSLSLLPLMALWAAVFYYAMIDQVNDDTDDVLEKYSEMIIMRMLSDHPLPEKRDGNNNSYTLTRVSEDYASKQTGYVFRDAEVYIAEQQEWEPARLLTTIFRSGDGAYYELIVSMPTFEKTDLLASILQWVVYLYAMLLLIVLGMTTWVFNRSLGPVYRLLQWLDGYTLGGRNEALPEASSIDEFRRLYAAVHQTMKRSEEAFEQQKQFIGNASHELQTPLAVLRARLDWLLDHAALEKEAVGHVVSMQRTLSHAVRLNKTLLLLAKIDNNQFADCVQVDLARVCREQVALCGELFEGRGLHAGVRLPERFTVLMNEPLAEVLVSNLVRNAYIHSACGAFIDVYTEGTTLVVENDGERRLDGDRIFERFYQGSKREGSTGLGLALVRAVCNCYGLRAEYDFRDGRHRFRIVRP